MKNAMFMRIVDATRQSSQEFDRAPNGKLLLPNDFIELAALEQIHAEIAVTIVLANFVDRNDRRMIEPGRGFRFATKPAQMALGRPTRDANHFQGDDSIETLLPRP